MKAKLSVGSAEVTGLERNRRGRWKCEGEFKEWRVIRQVPNHHQNVYLQTILTFKHHL